MKHNRLVRVVVLGRILALANPARDRPPVSGTLPGVVSRIEAKPTVQVTRRGHGVGPLPCTVEVEAPPRTAGGLPSSRRPSCVQSVPLMRLARTSSWDLFLSSLCRLGKYHRWCIRDASMISLSIPFRSSTARSDADRHRWQENVVPLQQR
jgi:hypothetical protein